MSRGGVRGTIVNECCHRDRRGWSIRRRVMRGERTRSCCRRAGRTALGVSIEHVVTCQRLLVVTECRGKVRIGGSVSERNMRYALESVTASCLGVKDVDNQVKVESAGQPAGSQAARSYSTAQRYARESKASSSPSSTSSGMTNTSVSDTHGLGGDQSRFIRPHTD